MTQGPPVIDYSMYPAPRRGFGRSIFGWVLFIGLAVMLFVLVQGKNRQTDSISASDFESLLSAGSFRSITIESDEVLGDLMKPTVLSGGATVTTVRVSLPQGLGQSWPFYEHVMRNRGPATVHVENGQNLLLQVLLPLVPWLLIFGFIWFFVFRQLRGKTGVAREPMPVIVVNQQQQP
jgi:ATP-dependent Zn protease